MVTARIEIQKRLKEGDIKYVVFYVTDDFPRIPIMINGDLYHNKVLIVKSLIKSKGGSNHIKREILIGNVVFQDGMYLI